MKFYNEILGKEIEIPENPKRLISFCPSITEMLIKFNKIDKIVGVSAYCKKYFKELNKPIVGSYIDVKTEVIKSLNPDLILTLGPAQLKISKLLYEIGYTVFPLKLPITPYGLIENLIIVGILVNEHKKAYKIAKKLLNILNKALSYKPLKRPSIYFEVWLNEPYTVGALTFTNGLIYLAGGRNIFHNRMTAYFKPNFNEVKNLNPDILVFEFEDSKEQKRISDLIAQRNWNDLNAVKHKKILKLKWPNFSIAHPSISSINSTILLLKKIKKFL